MEAANMMQKVSKLSETVGADAAHGGTLDAASLLWRLPGPTGWSGWVPPVLVLITLDSKTRSLEISMKTRREFRAVARRV
jgi:hypothetical protein